MNIVVLPIIVAVMLSTIIGVYSISSNSEYTIADNAIDSMIQLTEKKNESLAAFVKDNTLHLDNHGLKESEVYLIDFVLYDGTKKRVMYSQQGSQYDIDTTISETRLDSTLTPLVKTGSGLEINLDDENYNINPAEVQSASITTMQGNKFLVDLTLSRQENDGTGDGTGDGQAMIDGMGIQSRIIQQEYTAKLIHGSGTVGVANSLVPYLSVDSNTDFVGLVEDTDKVLSYHIPEFWHEYNYREGFTSPPSNAMVTEAVSWTNTVGVTADGNTLRKNTSSHACDAGAVSTQTISGDGYVSWSFLASPRMHIGLSNGDADQSRDDIDYSIDAGRDRITIYENGNYKFREGGLSVGDNLKISVESNVVKYYVNNILKHTSTLIPTYPLSVDTSICHSDGILTGVTIRYDKDTTLTKPDRLEDVTVDTPNILGYSEARDIVGSNTISINDGIVISGSGTSIIKLHNYESSRIILTGTVGSGDVKLITPASIDFMTAPYGTHGFTIPARVPVIVGLGETHYGTAEWDSGYTQISSVCVYDFNPHAVQYRTPVSNHSIVDTTFTTSDMSDHTQITSIGGYSTPSFPADTGNYYGVYGCSSTMYSGVTDGWASGVTLKLYDTLPAYTKLTYTEDFVKDYTFPAQAYLYVKPNGGTVTIKGQAVAGTPELKINNLPTNTPYQLIKDGLPIIAGMTSQSGEITINDLEHAPPGTLGILKLYPDSLSYRGSFSTVVLDNLNHQTIHIEDDADKVYTVHAYANIPVTGNIIVTNLNLDGTLPLSYLDGNYTSGSEIQVPVIPGYNTIHLEINGIAASLQYGDILGSTGITIAEPSTSTINTSRLDSAIYSAESVTGTTAYTVATTHGTLKAIISETISGDVTITNSYHLEKIPPPPPRPVRKDPLSGYVDVFVNGVLVKEVTLGVNPYPDFTPSATSQGLTATQSVRYSYPDYVLSGAVSVPVNPGDFVEFFVYGKIYGEINRYSTPPGYKLLSSSGTSTATVNIRLAHIQTSQ